jgi:signal peptidase I
MKRLFNLKKRQGEEAPEPYVLEPVSAAPLHTDNWKSVLSTLGIVILAPVIALLLINFVFQSYEVDGSSMETTLHNHDRLIVLKVQRSWARITKHDYIPSRGEIVIFDKKGLVEYGGASERQLIKRVIGLPGERIVVKDGLMTVYNRDHPAGFQPDTMGEYGKNIPSTSGDVDVTIPAGQIFVCGDNRSNSLDSRVFGPVPAKDIVGNLGVRVYPFSDARFF